MAKVRLKFEPDQTDFRDHQVSCQLTIENTGASAVEIASITPRIPQHASLLETKDISGYALKAQHTKLCTELTALAKDVQFITDEPLRKRLVAANTKLLNDVVSAKGIANAYLAMFTGRMAKNFEEYKKKEASLFVTVETAADASRLYTDIVSSAKDLDDGVKRAYKIKADKLTALESQIGFNIKEAAVARIEPGSFFQARYIVEFPRNWFNTSQFTVSIEAVYAEVEAAPQKKDGAGNAPAKMIEQHSASATAGIRISPKPVMLTLIAMLAAGLGVILKHAMALSSGGAGAEFAPGAVEFLGATILALVFFNVFEYTDLLKDFRKNISWRTALLIGVVCGMGSDRIYAAFRTLAGDTPAAAANAAPGKKAKAEPGTPAAEAPAKEKQARARAPE